MEKWEERCLNSIEISVKDIRESENDKTEIITNLKGIIIAAEKILTEYE